jgi:hypothetical protein
MGGVIIGYPTTTVISAIMINSLLQLLGGILKEKY